MNSFAHNDKRIKDIKNLVEGPTQELDDTTLTAESKCPITFTQPNKKFLLSLRYNISNSFLFVNATKIYQFKAKNSEFNCNCENGKYLASIMDGSVIMCD